MHDTIVSRVDRAPVHRKSGAARTCDPVIALVSNQKHVPTQLLTHSSRGHLPAARARQLAMYLSHVVLGRTLTEIGHAFGRDRTTVSYACALIEDMRDDPAFDEEVTQFEQRLESMVDEGAVHG